MEYRKLADHEVIKHTAAIHVSNTITLLQRKLSNVLLKNAYENLMTCDKHTISVSELAEAIGFDSKDEQLLKDSLRALNATQLEWNVLGKDKKQKWGVTTILAWVEIGKGTGICEYEYSKGLREMLLNPNIYARLDLLVQREIRSKHTLALWEYLMGEFALVDTDTCITSWMSLDKFYVLLGIPKDEYKKFKVFNDCVLKKAVKEINTLNLKVKEEFKREQRRVVALRFHVIKNKSFQPRLNLGFPQLAGRESAIDIKKENNALLNRLFSFGLTEETVKDILKNHAEKYIAENLDIVEKNINAGKVADIPAYTITALKKDYRPKETPVEKEKKTKAAASKAKIVKAKRMEILNGLKSEYDFQRMNKAINALPENELKKLKEEFLGAQRKQNGFVFQYHREHGFDNLTVKGAFIGCYRDKLLPRDFALAEFEAFIESKGHKAADFKDELKSLA